MAHTRTYIMIATAAAIWSLTACTNCATTPRTQHVSLGGEVFELELALDERMQHKGLSDRKSIDPDGGMLFVFPTAKKLEFLMRRCYVPLDLIYLDTNGYVIRMHRMQIEPDPLLPDRKLTKYRSVDPAQFAIELRGGTIERLKLKIADRIDLPLNQLKVMARNR